MNEFANFPLNNHHSFPSCIMSQGGHKNQTARKVALHSLAQHSTAQAQAQGKARHTAQH
jgi:hypothetical protein